MSRSIGERRLMGSLGRTTCLIFALSLGATSSLRAQTEPENTMPLPDAATLSTSDDGGQVIQKPAGPPPTPRHTGIKAMFKDLGNDVKHLPSRENLFWAGLGGGLALAVHP